MRRFFYVFLFLLFFYIPSFAEKGVYKAYVYFIPVGEITFDIGKNSAVVKGETYKSLRWLYNYTFLFKTDGKDYYLYEKENKKEKTYKNEQINEKKPWLPLIVKFIMEGEKPNADDDPNFPYKIKEKKDRIIIYPLKSKRVKRIVIKKSSGRLPEKIEIEGKIDITLERIR